MPGKRLLMTNDCVWDVPCRMVLTLISTDYSSDFVSVCAPLLSRFPFIYYLQKLKTIPKQRIRIPTPERFIILERRQKLTTKKTNLRYFRNQRGAGYNCRTNVPKPAERIPESKKRSRPWPVKESTAAARNRTAFRFLCCAPHDLVARETTTSKESAK